MSSDGNKAQGKKRQPGSPGQASTVPLVRRRKRGKLVKVSITQELGAQPLALLEKALDVAGFWRHIEQTRRSLGLRRNQFRIIIKPDLDVCDSRIAGGTDPVLVEHLIDLLHERGFRKIAVGDGRNEPDAWLHNRDPLVVPDLAGYRFVTAKGYVYDFVDLQSKLPASHAFPSNSFIPVSKHWSDASYRINFAKNKTHEEYAFALCVHNLTGLVGAKDARGRLRRRFPSEDCLEILRLAPPHFNIIDAFTSCHGGAGHRAPRPMQTHAFIASEDALLADWVGAAKMGLDPHASPVNCTSLRHVGLPPRYEIEGDLTPYPLWRNVHPLIAHTARLRSRADGLGQIVAAWFQSVDRERFPFKDFYNDRINSFVSPLMTRLDENPRSFWAVVFLNYAIAGIGSAILSQYTMFSKNKLRWRIAPLQLDPAAHAAADYKAIPNYLSPFMRLLDGSPANRNGLRWRHVDGSILFSSSHVFPIPFEKFVSAVDIACAIQYMNDYVGGSTVVVRRDSRRRAIHQAERNLYLQQPNWMVLFGSEVIDVEKLELIEYEKARQTIYWRTVGSPNDSASHDDGSVCFLRTGADRTTVRIFARQKFSLPLFFRLVDIDMAPGIRDPIIESGYTTFFAGTMANMQAKYEGRSFRIGQDAGEAQSGQGPQMGDLPRYLATAASAVAELLRHRGDMAKFGEWLFRASAGASAERERNEVDRDGFRHFGPASAGAQQAAGRDRERASVAGLATLIQDAPDFVTGLAEAVRNDLERIANRTEEGSVR